MVGICRLCASIKPKKLLITVGEESELCQRILTCYHVEMAKEELLPKSVCQECVKKLNSYYEYYKNVQQAQESLRVLFPSMAKQPDESLVSVISYAKNENHSKPSLNTSNENLDIRPLAKIELNSNIEQATHDVSMLDETEAAVVSTSDQDPHTTEIVEVQPELEDSKSFFHAAQANVSVVENSGLLSRKENTDQSDKAFVVEDNIVIKDGKENITIKFQVEEADETEEYTDEAEAETEGEETVDQQSVEHFEENESSQTHEDEEEGEMEYIEILEIQNFKKEKQKISQHNTRDWFDYPWHCFKCTEVYHSLQFLLNHCQTVHDLLPSQVSFKCAECQKVWEKYYAFLNHVRFQHRPELALCCDGCNLHCETDKQLASHREQACSQFKNDIAFQFYQCPECSRAYQNKTALQIHYKQHTEETFFKCDLCSKFFRRYNNLKVHIARVHSENKNYKCKICGAQFGQKVNLTSHMCKHSDEKPFQCSVCKKNFKTSFNLQKHALLHTEKKEFKCDFCESYFRTKDAKLSHERTHTKEKPYKCPYCIRSFSYRSVLKPHIHTHTGHRPFKCPFCDKGFTNWSNYNKHTKRIHNITATELAKRQSVLPDEPIAQTKEEESKKTYYDFLEQSIPDEFSISIYQDNEGEVTFGEQNPGSFEVKA